MRPIPEVSKAGYWLFCNLLKKIDQASEAIGKDGKFQIFICVGIRYVKVLWVCVCVCMHMYVHERGRGVWVCNVCERDEVCVRARVCMHVCVCV